MLALAMVALAVDAVVSEAGSWRDIADAVVSTLPATVPLLTLAVGCVLLGVGWPRRLGRGPTCGRCGYTMLEPPERLVPLCPECANPWRYFGRSSRGTRTWRTGYVAAGVLALVLAAAGAWMQARMRAAILAGLPTSTLLRHLSSLTERSRQAWTTLGTRTLTPHERDALERAVLDRRVRLGGLESGMESWLDHEVFMGRLGPVATDRYYRELTVAGLRVGPSRLVAGESAFVAVEVAGRRADLRTPHGSVWVIVDGYEWIALDPLPDRPPVAFRAGDGTGPGRTDQPWPAAGASNSTRLAFTPLSPGRALLRARGWIVVSPVRHVLAWGEGDGPMFDAAPVHVRPFQVEREIVVE